MNTPRLPRPVVDYLAAVQALGTHGTQGAITAGVALLLSWFVYVPAHELLHAWGCMLAGGSVSRLDIAPHYGGALLSAVFPYVVSGSDYAGQLKGFDVHGNDAIYLATVLAPYVLTVVVGVPVLRHAVQHKRAWLIGAALPVAYAPFISITGDFYETGSILVSRVAPHVGVDVPLSRWRGDDVLTLVQALTGVTLVDGCGIALSLVTGLCVALLVYQAGGWLAAVEDQDRRRP